MKATGIVRRVDDLGRIVIPKELRCTYGIKEGDPLEIFVSDQGIVFRKYINPDVCRLCGRDYGLIEIDDVTICKSCAEKLAKNYYES